jgi:hypothetical protein
MSLHVPGHMSLVLKRRRLPVLMFVAPPQTYSSHELAHLSQCIARPALAMQARS